MLYQALAMLLTCFPSGSGEEDARDSITLKGGQVLQGRVVQNHEEEFVYLREPGKASPRREKRERVIDIAPLVRNRIETWLEGRKPGQTSDERFARVQAAHDAELFALARLQAYDILCDDPDYSPAHLWLGHEEKKRGWMWALDTLGERAAAKKKVKLVPQPEFDAEIKARAHGLVLESENYRLETNTSLQEGVNLLFDLEATYCAWMKAFGKELIAAETVWDTQNRMVVCVYSSRDEGYTSHFSTERHPYYAPSRETTVADSPNVVFTYYEKPGDGRPAQFFDLAIQQLLFTTLGLGHKRGGVPSVEADHWAHWLELGFGWYMERGFGGPPGYAQFTPPTGGTGFILDTDMAVTALSRASDPTLSRTREEITNLIGMAWVRFYPTSRDGEIHRAKARTLVAYLMSQNPPAMTRGHKPSGIDALTGLMCYMRGAFVDPKAHSSSEFDKCIDGKVEGFEDGWKDWLKSFVP